MRHLNVQLQPDRATSLDLSKTRAAIEELARNHAIVAGFNTNEGDDHGRYTNFTFLANDPRILWDRIQAEVLGDPEIGSEVADCSIIVCEGEHGWEDYLLLHHFDPAQKLDEF